MGTLYNADATATMFSKPRSVKTDVVWSLPSLT